MMRRTRGFVNRWLFLLVTVVLSFCQTGVGRGAEDRLLSEARRERGTVRWYTALNVNGSKPLADAFEKKYPFLKVAINRLSNERIMNRIFAEAQSGAPQFDVTSFAYLPLLAEKGLLARYLSPQTKSYLEGFSDPKDHWTTMYSNLIVLGYNAREVSATSAPRDWSDLLDPHWNDKIGMDPEVGIWYGAMLHYMGKEKGEKFFRSLAQQKIQWRRGHSLLAQLMTADRGDHERHRHFGKDGRAGIEQAFRRFCAILGRPESNHRDRPFFRPERFTDHRRSQDLCRA